MFTVGLLGFGLMMAIPLLAIYAIAGASMGVAVMVGKRIYLDQLVSLSFGKLLKFSVCGWLATVVAIYALFIASALLPSLNGSLLRLAFPIFFVICTGTFYLMLRSASSPAVRRSQILGTATVPPVVLVLALLAWHVSRQHA